MSRALVQEAQEARFFEGCREAYEQHASVHRAALALGITHSRLHRCLQRHGYPLPNNSFTPEEVEVVREAYASPDFNLQELAVRMGRPKTNISRKARGLGLTQITRPKRPAAVLATAEGLRRWHQNNEHPRGATGIVHSAETRAKIAEKSVASNARHRAAGTGVYSEEVRQRSSDAMAKWRATVSPENVYSRAKRGVREDIGPMYFRSRWEANYARYLNWLQARGEIDRWEYEPDTFWFDAIKRGVRSYLPDFKVFEGPSVYYVEVKGWMDAKSSTKLKRMAKYHPTVKIIVFGAADYKSLSQNLGRIIPNWESER